MIEKYGLFDSMEGDEREYAEADFARLGRALGMNGVRGGADALRVSAAASGLDVNVAPGLALIQGRYYELEDDGSGEKTLSLTAASANPRVDRIVLTLNADSRRIALEVLKGTEAASPTAPALTRDAARWMLSLAQVYVAVGAGALTDETITDERTDEALCGLHISSADAKADIFHASDSEKYGVGDSAMYGHVRLSDTGDGELNADHGYAATPMAVWAMGYEAHKEVENTVKWAEENFAKKAADAAEGTLPMLDSAGNLASSGVTRSQVTFAKMTLSGTTLTITTVE